MRRNAFLAAGAAFAAAGGTKASAAPLPGRRDQTRRRRVRKRCLAGFARTERCGRDEPNGRHVDARDDRRRDPSQSAHRPARDLFSRTRLARRSPGRRIRGFLHRPDDGPPVYSLYGATRKPSAAMLAGVDVILFDIQDVGDRAYTYISTLAYVMQAAKAFGKTVWVLDRPNPIGGHIVEGPVLDPRFSSFIGLYALPVRHGMTVGELAKLYNEHFGIGCSLRVIAMENYTRDMLWPDTGLAWVQTSPNIPEWDTTLVYPATGLIDSAGINNGTGYTKPFKYAGASGLDGERLATFLNARPIPGIHFRAASWTPLSGFWAGKTLSGVELIVTDTRAFRAVRTAVELLVAIRTIAPGAISISSASALDRDWGTDTLRRGLQGGLAVDEILEGWTHGTNAFLKLREPYLLYA